MPSTLSLIYRTIDIVCILLLILAEIQRANSDFTITPSSQVVGVGQQAVFRCQNPNANVVGWMWNNSAVTESNRPPGVTPDRVLDENRNVVEYTLTIVAQSNYNETEVVCVAVIFGMPDQETAPVALKIQRPLSMVVDITRTSLITWKPPFSLNLTAVDPNIVYCVEVYNITCGVDDLVVSDCNVTEPRFVDNTLQQGYIYRITITPRSNGKNAQNGTSNTKEEMFSTLTDPKVILARGTTAEYIAVQLNYKINDSGIEPESYSLSLSPTDGAKIPLGVIPTYFNRSADAIILTVIQALPRRRLWSYQVLALGCREHPVTNLLELSTHDFQNVTVMFSNPGEVAVTGRFINGSTANSILVIIYSDSQSDVHYMFSPPSTVEGKLVATVRGLPAGLYNVSVFVVDENGLLFNRSATTPRNVSVKEGENSDTFKIKYEFHPTSTGICITCTFLDSSTTDCVAVVHQRISQLSFSGLMNIELSRKFNRSGDTAYGCIAGFDLEQYQVGVVGGRIIEPPPEQDSQVGIIIGVTVGISVPGVCSIVIGVTVVIIWKKKKRQAIHEKSGGESSSMRPLTAIKGRTQSQVETGDPAYDVLQHGPSQPSGSAKVEEGLVPTSMYNILDLNVPTGTKPDPSSAPSELTYATVGPSPVSREMVPQDFNETTVQYCTVQQETKEEKSFTEGVDGAGNRSCDCDGVANQELAMDQRVNVFHFILEFVAPELMTLTKNEKTTGGKQYQSSCETPSMKLDNKHTDTQGPLKNQNFHPVPVTIARTCGGREEWKHAYGALVLPGSYKLEQLRLFR